jgi:glycosyltransferase involved in cell wall biosynthesis
LKVLYLHQHFSTPSGAAGTRSYEMAKKLLDRGHEVIMVCGSYNAGETGLDKPFLNGVRKGRVDGIEVVEFELPYSNVDRFWKRTLTFIKFSFKSVAIALRYKYDLLFATSTPLTAGIPGLFAKLLKKKTFVFEVRDLWPELPKAMGVITNPVILILMSWLEWALYHFADACIGLAPGIVDGIKARGVVSEKIFLIPNGCDLHLFRDGEKNEGWKPEKVGINDIMAVYTGAHGVANGLDAVLDAAINLKVKGINDIKLIFVGEGKLKQKLAARAEKERLENCIFLDAIPKNRLSGLLAKADLGLMILANVPAFYYGTSPNKFFDYISTGIPVLNNYPGWLADMINEHGCGIVVKPDDPEAFAEALIHAADNRPILKKMGRCARELATMQFDRHILSDRFVDILVKIAET